LASVLASFWGKGGVGKTTLAAAAGLALRDRGLHVALVSTDPTPGLSRLLCSGGSAAPGAPARCAGVDVVEASEEDVKGLWKRRFGDEVYLVVSSLLPVGREIIDYVAGAPGIADQFTMYYVYTLAREGSYDVVVWDTPAAGGSLRMLRIEYELYSHMGEAARLYLRVKGALERLRRRDEGKTPLELVEEWRELAKGILDFLASPLHRLHLVATPDQLGVHVTRTLLREFRLHGIEARRLIINQLLDPEMCPGCRLLESWAQSQREALRVLQELGVRTCTVPLLGKEPRGVGQLARLAELLEEQDCLDVGV